MSIKHATNRQINTDPTKQVERKITLEAVGETSYKGKSFNKGETIEVNKDEAKAILKSKRGEFRIMN